MNNRHDMYVSMWNLVWEGSNHYENKVHFVRYLLSRLGIAICKTLPTVEIEHLASKFAPSQWLYENFERSDVQ